MRKGEKIFEIGGEGFGLVAYRVPSFDGGWRFYDDSQSIAIDEDDVDFFDSWKSPQFDSLGGLLDASSISDWFLIGVVRDLHPDHREELLTWAKKAYKALPAEFFRNFPAHSVVTPETWVDDHTKSREFRERRDKESAKRYDQLYGNRKKQVTTAPSEQTEEPFELTGGPFED